MKALVVVDYQHDFVEGSLGFAKAKKLEDIIIKKIEKCLSEKCDLVFTFDTHDENYLQTSEGKNLPIIHCQRGTRGHQLYGKVKTYLKDAKKVFYKDTFGSLELGEYLKLQNYKEIELCGLVTNMCILANAVIAKTAVPESRIVISKDAVMSFSEHLHEKTLEVLAGIYIDIV